MWFQRTAWISWVTRTPLICSAAEMGRVLCTCDADFIILAQEGIEHAGIVYGEMNRFSIGEWVRFIRRLHMSKSAEEVKNLVFYVEHE